MGRFHHILSVLAAVASVSAPMAALAKPQDYSFVEGVGGIKIKTPQRSDRGWTLPVDVNVAGTKTVTIAPQLVNSGLICEKTSARISGQSIWLRIHTGTARAGKSADCPAVQLGNIPVGDYRVFYEAGKRDRLNSGPLRPAAEIGRVSIIATNNNLY